MRAILPLLLLAACAPEADQATTDRTLYAGQGRDRLCIAGERAGFVAYGEGDTNCSVRGRIERTGANLALVPAGDDECRIPLIDQGDSVRFGQRSESCAYYCGPGADFSGRGYTARADASPAVDFAGDPLC